MKRWLRVARSLVRSGVIGLNRRNAEYIHGQNPRALLPGVDDKLRMHALCRRIGVPSPEVYAVVRAYGQIRRLPAVLAELPPVVIKPNRGAGGRGVLVWGREPPSAEELRRHVSEILAGAYSIGGQSDVALLQRKVTLHPAFDRIATGGIPDVRVIVYQGEPAMAMLRLPTWASAGRANLHQGGVGVGVELESGVTLHAVQYDRPIDRHPDTGERLIGRAVPFWTHILRMSRAVARGVSLGYLGVDVVIDAEAGPLLLEANARPGLAIQSANGAGLKPRLDAIDTRVGAG